MSQIETQAVDVAVDGTRLTGYLASPPGGGPGVMVLHAWWGLNPFFEDLCRRLAGEGFSVFAPDLNFGRVARTVDEAQALMQERDFERMQAVASAAVDWWQARSGGPLALVGFSMGASWSLALAMVKPDQVRAMVLFYGAEQVDFSVVRASVLAHYAETDEWVEEEAKQAMENGLRGAGLAAEFYTYPGTGHWFFETDRPDAYVQPAAALAWERTVQFLKREMGEGRS